MNNFDRAIYNNLVAGVDPKTTYALLGASLAGIAAPSIGATVDFYDGNTSPNEVLLNNVISALPFLGGGIGYLGGNLAASGIEAEIANLSKGKTGQQMKDELKEILRTQGEAAARQAFADNKNRTSADVQAALESLKGQRNTRRLAGTALGTLIGGGVAVPMMFDA